MLRLLTSVLVAAAAALPAVAADGSKCAGRHFVLWGDGRHDDTAALNAWFRGDPVVWGDSGRSIGRQIADRSFRLTGPVYIHSGTGRSIANFRFVWPERKELVAGGTIAVGDDPDKPPITSGLTKIGVGPGEGVPYPGKTPHPGEPDRTGCLVS